MVAGMGITGSGVRTAVSDVMTALALPFSLSIGFNHRALLLPFPLSFAGAVSSVSMTVKNWFDTYKQ